MSGAWYRDVKEGSCVTRKGCNKLDVEHKPFKLERSAVEMSTEVESEMPADGCRNTCMVWPSC